MSLRQCLSLIACWVGIAFAAADAQADGPPAMRLMDGVTIRPATVAEGQAVLAETDRFTSRLSRFDIESRVGKLDATRADFNAMAKSQVLDWPKASLDTVQAAVATVRQWLADQRLAPPFPREILLIYTTGKEEGNAAYCRGASIILPESVVKGARPQRMNNLLAHELFHILSANHKELQTALYATIGFKPCKPISLPPSLIHRKLTNPDGPGLDHYIQITHNNQSLSAVPLLFSNADRFDPKRGASFFDYLDFKLLLVAPSAERFEVITEQGQPKLVDPKSNESFYQQIGRNTGYIYHPDEILADNFVYLLQGKKELKTPRVVEQMRGVIRRFSQE